MLNVDATASVSARARTVAHESPPRRVSPGRIVGGAEVGHATIAHLVPVYSNAARRRTVGAPAPNSEASQGVYI
jgi:hypothetical protein